MPVFSVFQYDLLLGDLITEFSTLLIRQFSENYIWMKQETQVQHSAVSEPTEKT